MPGAGGQVRGELALDCERKGEKCHFEKKIGNKTTSISHLTPGTSLQQLAGSTVAAGALAGTDVKKGFVRIRVEGI